ncbi:MAG: sterol desaturase family protein [Spirochaetes bacterium]|jgi:sterol desaturase/sphingolipid hydroxylase (fatty acid hydroxylase superfamily)|nr:sterol desaturase family protein [Spirochaetota bacterium]
MMEKLLASAAAFVLVFSVEGVAPHFAGRGLADRARHSANNLGMGLANAVLVGLAGGLLAFAAAEWSGRHSIGLARAFDVPGIDAPLKAVMVFVLFDLWMYWWHRLNHRVRPLWMLHRAHHADRAMDASTAVRFHPLEILASSLLRPLVIVLLGMDIAHLALYEAVLLPVILFHHGNIALPSRADRALRALIVTPDMHRVHHSRLVPETHSNYSSVFSLWDRLFGSYRERDDTRSIDLGLNILRADRWQGFAGILLTPFASMVSRRGTE